MGASKLLLPKRALVGVGMSLQSLSDASVSALYENIREQVAVDRPSKYRFTAGESARRRAEELRNELIRRRLQPSPIEW